MSKTPPWYQYEQKPVGDKQEGTLSEYNGYLTIVDDEGFDRILANASENFLNDASTLEVLIEAELLSHFGFISLGRGHERFYVNGEWMSDYYEYLISIGAHESRAAEFQIELSGGKGCLFEFSDMPSWLRYSQDLVLEYYKKYEINVHPAHKLDEAPEATFARVSSLEG